MLTETLSGKCPCCEYDKLLQRYGSEGYFQLDACPRCGFGHGSNGDYNSAIGPDAWLDYGAHILAMLNQDDFLQGLEDDPQVVRHENGYTTNGGETREEKAYRAALVHYRNMDDLWVRKLVYEWAQKQLRCDDVQDTIFKYTPEIIAEYKATNPVIFN